MKFSVRDYRAAERVDCEGDHIIVVAGRNNQGKSSTLEAVGLAATGNYAPLGFLKKEVAELVRWGAKEGSATIDVAGSATTVEWPKCKIDAGFHNIDMASAGLVSIATLNAEQRAIALGEIINAVPTLVDLEAACKDAEIGDETRDRMWKRILDDGWDSAYQVARDRGATLKGKWEQVAGRKWGAKLAAEFVPEALAEAAENPLSLGDLEELVAQRRAALERAIENQAVDSAELQRQRELAAGLDDAQAKLDAAKKVETDAQDALQKARKDRDEAGELPPETPLSCPHCGGLLDMKRTGPGQWKIEELQAEDVLDDKARKALRSKIAGLDGTVERLGIEYDKAKQAAIDANRALHASKGAQEALEALGGRDENGVGADKVAELRASLESAETLHRAAQTKVEADRIHGAIEVGLRLQEILAPDGLRKRVLGRAVQRFNEDDLKPVYEAAGWPIVEIEPDMTIKCGGASYRNLGESHKMIARIALQIAMARKRSDAFIIVDGVDMLDPGNRNGLFKALVATGLPAIVGMTVFKPDLIANLTKIDAVSAYWLADGISQPLAQVIGG